MHEPAGMFSKKMGSNLWSLLLEVLWVETVIFKHSYILGIIFSPSCNQSDSPAIVIFGADLILPHSPSSFISSEWMENQYQLHGEAEQ